MGTLGLATPPERPLILVGDFNLAPTEPAGAVYDIIRTAVYADTWQHNRVTSSSPDGFTCCQASDLTNDVSLLDSRIDHIFVKNNLGVLPFSFPCLVFATILGDAPISAAQPKWISDHTEPFAVLLGIPLFKPLGSRQLAGTPSDARPNAPCYLGVGATRAPWPASRTSMALPTCSLPLYYPRRGGTGDQRNHDCFIRHEPGSVSGGS